MSDSDFEWDEALSADLSKSRVARAFIPESEIIDNFDTVQNCLWTDCNDKFDNLDQVVSHINNTHISNDSNKDHCCNWRDCSRKGVPQASRFSLMSHVRSHTGERPFYCLLPECPKHFTRSDALLKHIKTIHNIDSPNEAQEEVFPWWYPSPESDKEKLEFINEKTVRDRYLDLLERFESGELSKDNLSNYGALFNINHIDVNNNLKKHILERAKEHYETLAENNVHLPSDDDIDKLGTEELVHLADNLERYESQLKAFHDHVNTEYRNELDETKKWGYKLLRVQNAVFMDKLDKEL
ncbi:BA75_03026T0 [Komagataella pastoris]|uniref:BA75_03026T0 n=1 Tax=Komagataella pastoris TaxID=4922 RepID=A0A1B2JDZ5_PICPA|nr:BA75_03026T0 [Komagataella pastoris]